MPLQPLGATERIRRLREKTLAIYRSRNQNTVFADNATLIAAQLGESGYVRQNASGSLIEEPCCNPCELDTTVIWSNPVALIMTLNESTGIYSYSGVVATITSCLPVQIEVEQIPELNTCIPGVSGLDGAVLMNKQGDTWIYTLAINAEVNGTYTQGIGFVFTLSDGSIRSVSQTITFILPDCA